MDSRVEPEKIGGFKILRRLATGGTADVLLAREEGPHGFERVVVLKRLLAEFQRDTSFARMFAREASAYARLAHPAIVRLYDFFETDGELVMVLEYVDGLPLHTLISLLKERDIVLDDRAAIYLGTRIFGALAAAHDARELESEEHTAVIHRDVNPSNVLIPWDGRAKLADFGIAKITGQHSETQAGLIKGTYGYMAPEQVRGEVLTPRADVYAASLVLWELLARRKAIERGALPEVEVLRAMAEPQIASLDVLRYDLPARIRAAIRRGLEPNPEHRSMSAEEMLTILRASANLEEGRRALVDAMARVRAATEAESMETKDALPRLVPPPPSDMPRSSRAGDTLVGATDPRLSDDDVVALAKAVVNLGPIPTPPPPNARAPMSVAASTARSAVTAGIIPRASTPPPPIVGSGRQSRPGSQSGSHPNSTPGESTAPNIPRPDSTLRYGATADERRDSSGYEQHDEKTEKNKHPGPVEQDEEEKTLARAPETSRDYGAGGSPRTGTLAMNAGPFAPAPSTAEMRAGQARTLPSSQGQRPAQGSLIFPLGMDVPKTPFPNELGSIPPESPPNGPAQTAEPAPDPATYVKSNTMPMPGPSSMPAPFVLPSIPTEALAAAPIPSELAPANVAPEASPAPIARPIPIVPAPSSGGSKVAVLAVLFVLLAGLAIGVVVFLRVKHRNGAMASASASAMVAAANASASAARAHKVAVDAASAMPSTPPTAAFVSASTPASIASSSPSASAVVAIPSATATSTATTSARATVAATPPATTTSSLTGTDLTITGIGAHHRVFFDGHVVGETPGPLHVACGSHTIKVGSGGKDQHADLPCGDAFSLSVK